MQKLPEAPDRIRGNACTKKGTVSAKEKPSFFSSDQQSDNTKNLSCCWWKAPYVRL